MVKQVLTPLLMETPTDSELHSDKPLAVLSSVELSMGIINALVGTAILTFPRLTHLTGVTAFAIIIAFCGFTLFVSMILLAKSTEMADGEISLHELTRLAFSYSDGDILHPTWLSRTLPILVDIFLFIDCFFTNVLYINFVSHFTVSCNSVLHGLPSGVSSFNYKIVIGVICVILTVVAGDSLSKLRWVSTVGFVALVLTTFFTIVSPFWLEMEYSGALTPDATTKEGRLLDMCEAFSIAGFALVNYFCASSFYAETKDKRSFTPVVFVTFVLLVTCFTLYGVFGAASIGSGSFFDDSDEADIFPYYYIYTSYTSAFMKKVTGFLFITLSVTLVTKVPIFSLPMVDAVKEMIIQVICIGLTKKSLGPVFSNLTKLLVGGAQIFVALYCDDLSLIMTLIGAIVLAPVSYVFPAAIYVRLSDRMGKRNHLLTSSAYLIAVIGILQWVYGISAMVQIF